MRNGSNRLLSLSAGLFFNGIWDQIVCRNQMKLLKIKTDKSDSKLICEYAKQVELKLWKGNSKHQTECLEMIRLLSVYTKQSTMLKNKLHGEGVLGNPSKAVMKSLKRSLKHV